MHTKPQRPSTRPTAASFPEDRHQPRDRPRPLRTPLASARPEREGEALRGHFLLHRQAAGRPVRGCLATEHPRAGVLGEEQTNGTDTGSGGVAVKGVKTHNPSVAMLGFFGRLSL